MKFLVIRFSSIGDIVLTTPVIRCLKKQIVTAEVHFLTKASFRAVTKANPFIDKFFYLEDDLDNLIRELMEEDYDYVIDLHNNLRSMKVKKALKKKSYTVEKLILRRFFLTEFHIEIMPGKHIVDRNLDTVREFGIINDGAGLDYFVPPEDLIEEKDLPASHLAGYIAIVIGGSYSTKKMPVYKFWELCNSIDHPIILLGGKEDSAEGEEIASVDPKKIYNSCGKFNLNEAADILRRSKLVISHDTGLLHIACAFNKPVLELWGATSPKLGMEPYYGNAFLSAQKVSPYENILVPGLPCQPCSKHGTKKCPRGHFRCMKNMDIPLIAGKVKEFAISARK